MLFEEVQHDVIKRGGVEVHVHGMTHVRLDIGLEGCCLWESLLDASRNRWEVRGCPSEAVSAAIDCIFV